MSEDASFLEGTDSALYLGAFTSDDVEVISTILQDGIFFMTMAIIIFSAIMEIGEQAKPINFPL